MGEGAYIIKPLHCHHQNDFHIKMGSDVGHFNVSFIVWRDKSVHKSQCLKRKVSRSGESNLRPSGLRAERLTTRPSRLMGKAAFKSFARF